MLTTHWVVILVNVMASLHHSQHQLSDLQGKGAGGGRGESKINLGVLCFSYLIQ